MSKGRRAAGVRMSGVVSLCAVLAASAWAVQPGRWDQASEADFEPGRRQDVVLTSQGDLKLSAASKSLAPMPEKTDGVYDVQTAPDGWVYLASGPETKLLRTHPDDEKPNLEVVQEYKDEQVFALDLTPEGNLLIAVSGSKSRLEILSTKDKDAKPQTLVELPGVRYVWDMAIVGQSVLLATGTEGKLLRVELNDPSKVTTLLDAPQSNLLCVGVDRAGRAYAGTDGDGLVYRVSERKAGLLGGKEPEVFVLYDAAEPEVSALLVQPDGTVYAGTASGQQAGGKLQPASRNDSGKAVPATATEPAAPAPDRKHKEEKPAASGAGAGEADKQAEPEGKAEAKHAEGEPASEKRSGGSDALREEIRRRLERAKSQGQAPMLPAPGGPGGSGGAGSGAPGSGGAPGAAAAGEGRSAAGNARQQGNALYRIDPQGLVTEVFRESAMMLRIVQRDSVLLVATGPEGELYSIDPATLETAVVADLLPKQLTALLPQQDGSLIVAGANPAALVRLSDGYAKSGQYTSKPMDAGQISLWGEAKLLADIPEGCRVEVSTRSGNVADPERGLWSDWSKPKVIEAKVGRGPGTPISWKPDSAPARFLQYRLELTSNGPRTPAVSRLQWSYMMPNLRPRVTELQTQAIADPAQQQRQQAAAAQRAGNASAAGSLSRPEPTEPLPLSLLNIQWKAIDPNKDALVYALSYREEGQETWLPLEERIPGNAYQWDTRRVPDGRYVIRLTASDQPDNPEGMALTAARETRAVVVDNSPPAVSEVKLEQRKGQVIVIQATFKDQWSDIAAVHYMVGGKDRWQAVLPEDLIFDSTEEQVVITLSDLAPGSHLVTLRASDTMGNTLYRAVPVQVK